MVKKSMKIKAACTSSERDLGINDASCYCDSSDNDVEGWDFDVRNIPEFQDVFIRSARVMTKTFDNMGMDKNMGERQSKQCWQKFDGRTKFQYLDLKTKSSMSEDQTYRDDVVEWNLDFRTEYLDEVLKTKSNLQTDSNIRSSQRQSNHYLKMIEECHQNQEWMMQWMEEQSAMKKAEEALFEEKVNAEVARRMEKAFNRDPTETSAVRLSCNSALCETDADDSTPLQDTTNILSLNRPKKLIRPKCPENASIKAREEESRRLQTPGKELSWG